MLRSEIQKQIQAAVAACWPALEQPRPSGKDIATPAFDVVVPEQREHGDYASNIGLVLARELKKNPMEVAQELAKKLSHPDIFSRVEVAKPGFLNFFINDVVFFRELDRVVKNPDVYGTGSTGD
jgi:arginyl-tRNA synthetase